jgi:hypothetical protein
MLGFDISKRRSSEEGSERMKFTVLEFVHFSVFNGK